MNLWTQRFLRIAAPVLFRAMAAWAILGAIGNNASSQVIRSWVARYDGPGNGGDGAMAIVLDEEGNVYVTGYSLGYGSGTDYATIKYDSAGAPIWVARYNGPGDGDDYARAIALDSSGNIYVTGSSPGSASLSDFATIKYDLTGMLQWLARYNGPAYGDDEACALAVDAEGNTYVTGWSWGLGTDYDYVTIKYDADGIEQWVATYNSAANCAEYALALVIDSERNVCVTGSSWTPETANDWATVKYNPSGMQQWVTRYTNPWLQWPYYTFDVARDLVLDGNGNIYVAGGSFGYTYYDFETIKYSPTGGTYWEARWDGWNGQNDEAYALALDHSGNVVVAGYGESGSGIYVTIKYNNAGAEQWEQTFDAGSGYNCVLDVAIDLYDNIYITGAGQGDGSNYVTIRYSPDGLAQWAESYNGPGNGADNGEAVAVDAMGNVYVTGSSTGSGTGLDYATIKYAPTVSLTLTPLGAPIQIPASGGGFSYNLSLTNHATSTTSCDTWCTMILPDSSLYGPVLGPVRVRLQAEETISRERTQTVPERAPAGQYSYNAYVGTYPSAIWSQDSFDFTKLETGRWGLVSGDWTNTGEEFVGGEISLNDEIHNSSFIIHNFAIRPNPFNPMAVLRFELPDASFVKLGVYDISGRLVSELVNGWRDAGSHQITFDGSALPSGIYFAKLVAGDFNQVQKMVLLK